MALFGPTLRGALARGVVKQDDPSVCRTQGKEKARWQMVKPMLGIAGKALIKANYQGVPIITQPRKERKNPGT